jgi:hypothetical protein
MRLGDAQRIHEAQHVGNQHLEGVAAGRRLGGTMAALIIPQHSEALLECARLLLPHETAALCFAVQSSPRVLKMAGGDEAAAFLSPPRRDENKLSFGAGGDWAVAKVVEAWIFTMAPEQRSIREDREPALTQEFNRGENRGWLRIHSSEVL